MTETLTVDDLTFEVRRSSRRETVEITIDRTGDLILLAPDRAAEDTISGFVQEKREWIFRKLAEKNLFKKPRPQREFVTGEGFSYLGRNYRLKLVEEQSAPLKLVGGRFQLRRRDRERGREQFVLWYRTRGQSWVERRIPQWADRLGAAPSRVRVLDLGHRWGSCSPDGSVNIHWTTMQLPPSIIDYVLVHELAHLREPRHGPEFWRLIERVLPDHEPRCRWLAEKGRAYADV